MRRLPCACALLVLAMQCAFAATQLADGIELIPGTFVPNHQPDGNSILFHTKAGLIVMDTGRHAEHTQRILDVARESHQPIVAVINSHWHLDHIGGNPRVRAAYPGVRVYASDALGGALQGFLADYRKQLESALTQASDETAKQSYRDEIAIIDAGKLLAPDEVITGTRTLRVGGRTLELHLQKYAVTAADVWVFDPATRTLAAGDLVTLPAPFLDTACPGHWQNALGALQRVQFKQLVPGHGAPMSRAQFATYRAAFDNLLACAHGDNAKTQCIDGWMRDAESLLADADRANTRALIDYYVDNSLRGDAKKTARLCGT